VLSRDDIQALRESEPTLEHALVAASRTKQRAPGSATIPTHARGFLIGARGLSQIVKGNKRILHDISISILPGELVAIIGGSGAGKTTLLDALSGVRPAATGTVYYDGAEYYGRQEEYRSCLGYVPQDDIIHRELPLASTLRYAAQLRLPAGTSEAEAEAAVNEALKILDLSSRADVRVDSLSGGQRKRASIGVELLTGPRVFFLDEPTSGLDPAIGADLTRLLRRLADAGSTVVLTTHVTQNIDLCDKLVVLAGDGYLAFVGTPGEAREYFGCGHFEEIYECLDEEADPAVWARRFEAREGMPADGHEASSPHASADASSAMDGVEMTSELPGSLRQWAVLSRRTLDITVRNRLTLAILIGSPVAVVAMFAILFQAGAFNPAHPSPEIGLMTLYWIAFGEFFFGLTFGLLQIVTEFPIVRRERLSGLGVLPYVCSKLTVLLPFLLFIVFLMLAVMRVLDRLPAAGWGTYTSLWVTLALDATAALALGLAASAAVSRADQATLALPMLCFPQVLFSGAMLAVPVMATVGKLISFTQSDRWAFEAMAHSINVQHAFGSSALGRPLLNEYGDSFSRAEWVDWVIMAGFAAVFLATACYVLARRTRPARRLPVSAGRAPGDPTRFKEAAARVEST
jgi:ABC-type multidrug transport system ATPase subunit